MYGRPKFPSTFELWGIYIYKLIFENYVCKEEIDQQERQDERSQEKVCNTQESKKQNPGDLPVVKNIWKFKFVEICSATAAALLQ